MLMQPNRHIYLDLLDVYNNQSLDLRVEFASHASELVYEI